MDNDIAERIAKALERIAESIPAFFEQGDQHLAEMADIRLALSAIAYAPEDAPLDDDQDMSDKD